MTRAEELARMNAQRLRAPKVDPFEQSRKDRAEQKRLDAIKNTTPAPAKPKPFVGGIPQTDAELNNSGVFQDE